MKRLFSIKKLIAFATPAVLIFSGVAFAQEYDDLYFTPDDRVKVKYADEPKATRSATEQERVEYNQNDYSSKTVNPEYIARYNRQSAGEEAAADSSEYYVENYDGTGENVVINNYYDNYYGGYSSFYRDPYHDPFWRHRARYTSYYDPFYDPFWDSPWHYRPGWNIGWTSAWGWPRYSGWYVSLGWGSHYHRPYYNRWGWDYYRPYGGYGYYSHWGRPYYSYGYAVNSNRVYYDGDGNAKLRNVTRGSYTSRSSTTALNNTATSRREVSGSTGRAVNGRVDNNNRYANVQSDYYRRARTRVSDDGASNARTRSVSDDRTVSPRTESQTRERARTVAPSQNDRSRYYNTRSTDSRRSTTVTPSENKNTTVTPSRSRSYDNTPTRSRSYSAPARSNDSGARRSYTPPSRNSGSSYTPSRSSSGSRNSSYTPSRSSGSNNSGTRSSSGSGSSSGSRRSR